METSACPGSARDSPPYMIAWKPSVVGSGPMCMPGNSMSRRYLMNEVLPVEYWPTSSTSGFASKSFALSSG